MNIPLNKLIYAYINFRILYILGILRSVYSYFFNQYDNIIRDINPSNFTPLYSSFDNFYINYFFNPIKDAFARTIYSSPNVLINLNKISANVINIGSYNYLGFGGDAVSNITNGMAMSSTRQELGNSLEQLEM